MKKIIIDVTSCLSSKYITGIQRVVIEISKRLTKYYDVILVNYNNLLNLFNIVDTKEFVNKFENRNFDYILNSNKQLNINLLNCNYIWLDLDSVWYEAPVSRRYLYPKLKKLKVLIWTFVHDILPLTNKMFFPKETVLPFALYIASIILHSDKILTSTQSNKNSINNLLKKCNINKEIEIIPLGSNFDDSKNINSSKIKNIINKKYILTVATIEPRKNHITLIDAFVKFHKKFPDYNLVIAGRKGWNYTEVFKTINDSDLYNKYIYVFDDLDDDSINLLYKKAACFVFASFAEGYGLPIIEALHNDCPVLISDIPVFREISKEYGIYFNPFNSEDLYLNLKYLLTNKEIYLRQKQLIKKFKSNSWDDSIQKIRDLIE